MTETILRRNKRSISVSGQCSHAGMDHGVWKAIWKLGVPRPMKMFMWRACHNLLPTRVNLVKRKVIDNALCPCCGRENETVLHVLWPAA
jgi:hypothetical protein